MMSLSTAAPLLRKSASTRTLYGKFCAQGHKTGHCVVHRPCIITVLGISVSLMEKCFPEWQTFISPGIVEHRLWNTVKPLFLFWRSRTHTLSIQIQQDVIWHLLAMCCITAKASTLPSWPLQFSNTKRLPVGKNMAANVPLDWRFKMQCFVDEKFVDTKFSPVRRQILEIQ
jgi:hypothetical protein